MKPAAAPVQTRIRSLRDKLPTWLHVSDLQGLAQLATQGTLGVTRVAEAVQGSIYKSVAAPFGLLGSRFVDPAPGGTGVKTLGITGLVYGSIKGVTRLAGGAVNSLLAAAVPMAGVQTSSPEREAMLSAINGVLGDRLLETANPLAITMQLRINGQALQLTREALETALPGTTGKVLVMVHGLCMNDLQWQLKGGEGHGEQLAKELGCTPVYLHYNTGLHTSTNGRQLSGLLDQLLTAWPQPVQELTLLTHSMGGLVARGACQHGTDNGSAWRKQLKRMVFLGTPHHGAPLEMLGGWVDRTLAGNVVTRPFARIGQIRSAGITDLRYGHVQDADWQGAERVGDASVARHEPLPLPRDVACFAVAATTLAEPAGGVESLKAQLSHHLVGDGLVPLPSALGMASGKGADLMFPLENQWICWSTNHMMLLRSPAVLARLKAWLVAT